MSKINVIKPIKISLKDSNELNETWLQEQIAKDPSILGLGDLIVRDKERIQPNAGRLDLLLQESENNKRYEVEIQLGKTDESHVIRTIEYWDIERKRYPQYEHCAVIVAEDITSRFLNVINLFNGHIPLIALQVSAYKIDENYFLTFTKVLDEVQLGLVEEDEEVKEVTDRNYWENNRGTKETIKIVDEVFEIIQEVLPGYELKYNKFYIGMAKNSVSDNFVAFKARKKYTTLEIKLEKSEEIDEKIEAQGLNLIYYKSKRYHIRLKPKEVKLNREILRELIMKSKGIDEKQEK